MACSAVVVVGLPGALITATPAAVAALTSELMTLQATGDFDAAKEILETRGVIRPQVERLLERLGNIPIDIQPRYVTTDALATASR